MKIIDLLNKIANGEEVPRKVKYKTYYWEYKQESKDYKDNEDDWVFGCSNYDIPEMLNNEVEILEEEKRIPEKLSTWFSVETEQSKELNIEYANTNFENMYAKINEIIDHLEYLKSKGE